MLGLLRAWGPHDAPEGALQTRTGVFLHAGRTAVLCRYSGTVRPHVHPLKRWLVTHGSQEEDGPCQGATGEARRLVRKQSE